MILNYNVYEKSLNELNLKTVRIINTINPHSYRIAKKDSEFKSALKSSDLLLPDGIGIVLAARLLNGKKIKKIAGYDIFELIMNDLNKSKGSCFFLGSSNNTLMAIKENSKIDYPFVNVSTYSPPYKPKFNQEENNIMFDKINQIKPNVLFVGMTAPKQEKWVLKNKERLNVDIICSIGAVFDFYAGTVERPHKIWIKLGLEWLPRFIKEPRRLAERNLVSTPSFVIEILSKKIVSMFDHSNKEKY